MNEKTKIGCFFLAVAAFLYSSKHLTAAIMVSNMNSTQANYFDGGYKAIGTGITIWSTLSLLIGASFFISGFFLPLMRRTVSNASFTQEIQKPAEASSTTDSNN